MDELTLSDVFGRRRELVDLSDHYWKDSAEKNIVCPDVCWKTVVEHDEDLDSGSFNPEVYMKSMRRWMLMKY